MRCLWEAFNLGAMLNFSNGLNGHVEGVVDVITEGAAGAHDIKTTRTITANIKRCSTICWAFDSFSRKRGLLRG